jgi:LuxR family maltose regulon positive regulatory protein
MAHLLTNAAARGILPDYVSRLLPAFGLDQERSAGEAQRSDSSQATQLLIEPLTHRELDVLRLLNTDLSGPEIAVELVIALSTVHTHTKSIYGKLNVTNRRAAVKRATELHLL